MKKINIRKKNEKIDVMIGWIFSLCGGFSPQKDMIETIQGHIDSMHDGDEQNNKRNRPYWEVSELDKEALNKAKQELQRVKEHRP